MSLRTVASLAAAALIVSCASPGNDTRAGQPNLSVAWNATEAVHYAFTEGCLKAVEANQPVKETIDRGVAISHLRTLETSPLPGDAAGTPAYAVLSGVTVVITGTGERCRIASSSGDGPELRSMLLNILDTQQTGWVALSPRPPTNPALTQDLRCRPINGGGVMTVQIVTASGHATPLQVFVFRADQAACSLS